ncbi:MAG: DUF1203 domain-containing protein [Chthoniobacterales bacterium]|nr:DUF1203 domain-containing protein [Chthoniobacterales bacterium]MBA3763341.1 DUF1203 domain-containing protein [Chthoniobacterales bacterium]
MTKNPFRVVALPTSLAETARRNAAAGARDHRTTTVESAQTAPCRHCLTWANPGERVILFPFQSISSARPYGESGPVFIHADGCEQYSAPNEFPAAFRSGRALRAYNEDDEIVAAQLAGDAPEELASEMFEIPEVQFLHVRSACHGCYTFKLERA